MKTPYLLHFKLLFRGKKIGNFLYIVICIFSTNNEMENSSESSLQICECNDTTKYFTKVISFHFCFFYFFSFNIQTSYWNSVQVYILGTFRYFLHTKTDAIFPRRYRKFYLIPLHYKSLLVHGEKKKKKTFFLHFVIINMEVMEVQTTTTTTTD